MLLKNHQINPWVVIATFAFLVAPFALSFHMHFPDEMYYSNAALKMLQNGDYLTTYLGNGELRFRKPIGTYWVVLAGFKLFGVSAFSSRIFFLLAGALTIGLTYGIAKVLFKDRYIAGISALVMAANPVLIFASTRSIPDVLLGFTMAASAIGFAGIISQGQNTPKKYLWLLYISLALAFEVKGVPALALGGLGILYLLFNPWKKIPFKTFVHFPALFTAVCIALFWFVAMWKIHGPTYLDSFFEDQVGKRVTSKSLSILKNGLLATAILFAIYIPWILFVIPKLKENIKKVWSENAIFFGFAILWGIAILGMGAMTAKFYERYLLPVAPVLSVLLGWILARSKFDFRIIGQKIWIWIFLSLSILIGIFGFWINFQLGSTIWIYLQLFIGFGLIAYFFFLSFRGEMLPKILSFSFLLVFFLLSTVTAKISLPEQGEQVSNFVSREKINTSEKIGFIGNIHVSSKIRIYLGTDYYLTDITGEEKLTDQELVQESNRYKNLIIEDDFIELFPQDQFEIHIASVNWDSKEIPFLLRNLDHPEFGNLVKKNGKIYYWLSRK